MDLNSRGVQKRRCPEVSHANEGVLDKIRKVMRRVQNQTGCATSTLDLCLRLLHPFLKGVEHVDPVNMKMPRRRPQSPLKLQLHGCVGCNNHVFGPKCHLTHCPKCNFPRNDSEGNPNEVQFFSWFPFCFVPSVSLVLFLQVCWYFPLKEQIGRLIKIPAYRELLMYEQQHRTNVGVMCDIYDSPRWAKIVGPIGDRLDRIVVHASVDGVPAFGRKNCQNIGSVKPINYFVTNLSPWLR